MLKLRHVLLDCRLRGKRPGQYEFGLEYGLATLDPAIQCGHHPAQDRVPDSPLNIDQDLPAIGLIPAPIEVLGHDPQLDDKIAGQIRWFGLTTFFAPQPQQRLFFLTHDDPGV